MKLFLSSTISPFMNKKILATLIATSSVFMSVSVSHAGEGLSPLPKISDEWRFEVTPYLWGAGISSTLFYNDRYLNTAKLSTSNVLGDLKSGGMISAEAHYGNWGMLGDIVSATLQTTSNINVTEQTRVAGAVPVHAANKVTMQQNIITGAATYTVLNNQNIYLDGLVGVRGIMATATVSLDLSAFGQSRSAVDSKSVSTADPIVGFKGRYRIADSTWYIPFYADIGGGGGTTNMTWQGILGVGKTFEKWVDVSLAYRTMYYDMKGDGLLQKTTFKGPQLAATFKF
ncbi:hypothetical protein VC159_02795 [Polynucleobacter sp. JS-JIR-II-c23]|uniref:hypothetical protein n=1 Tax=Polynucleobacter sp. JS-JIR-II-c23 TaxID=1758393 RepID=UPI002B2270B9|nr:hypothetical protein [Polynucleobacter sp. JS-JIR-II-c23]MEA9603378.1 hypothetical protein [Polynucleobacter sp. JS-JIR-II-c23]